MREKYEVVKAIVQNFLYNKLEDKLNANMNWMIFGDHYNTVWCVHNTATFNTMFRNGFKMLVRMCDETGATPGNHSVCVSIYYDDITENPHYPRIDTHDIIVITKYDVNFCTTPKPRTMSGGMVNQHGSYYAENSNRMFKDFTLEQMKELYEEIKEAMESLKEGE